MPERPSDNVVLDLVGSIYDAATHPDAWTSFLEKFANAVGGESTQLFYYDVERRAGNFAATVRLDPEFQRAYDEYYIGLDPYGIHGRKLIASGNVFPGQALCPDSILRNTEFYNDFFQHMDAFHQACGFILKESTVVSVISTLRPERKGPFSDASVELLRTLMPHLQRAFQLHRRLGGLEARASLAAEALDRIPVGLLIVGAAGKVVQLNRRAQAIIDLNDGLTLCRNGLTLQRSEEANRLRGLIQDATARGDRAGAGSGGTMKVSRPSLRRSFQVLVTPLRPATSPQWPTVAAAVFVSDPEAEIAPPEKKLAGLFDLTAAEARVAASLMNGNSVEDTANEFCLSRNTIRAQLRSVFDKTDTHRQGELIRLLWGSLAYLE